MIIQPARLDPARIRDALGIPVRQRPSVEEVLTALAALKAKRDALGVVTLSPYPPNASPEEQCAIASAALAELVRSHQPASPWGF